MRDDVPPASAHAPARSGAPAELWAGARWRAIARTAFPFVVVGGLWEVVARTVLTNRLIIVPFSTVLETMWSLGRTGELWKDLYVSLAELLLGFSLAVVIGIFVGFLMGTSPDPRIP